jgi:hypothetical protein
MGERKTGDPKISRFASWKVFDIRQVMVSVPQLVMAMAVTEMEMGMCGKKEC